MLSKKETKQILQDITHKTIGEIYTKFEFVIPKVYEATFNRKLLELNPSLDNFSIDKELQILLESLEDISTKNDQSLTKIIKLSNLAVDAINTQNIKILKEIKEEALLLQLAIKELSSAVYVDDITGFYNRNGFRKSLCTLNEIKFSGAIFSIDIDKFNNIITNYGTEIGNSVLKSFSLLLKNSLQNVQTNKKFFCRSGLDEFLIAVTEENTLYVYNELKKIQNKVYKLKISNEAKELSFSFGYSMFPKFSEFEKAIINADIEMIKNKKDRRKSEIIYAKKFNDQFEEFTKL